MSEQKFKLHFASAFIQMLREVKTLLLPAFIVLASNGFNISFKSFQSIFEYLPVLIIFIMFVITVGRGMIKWLTFSYWIEENELKTAYGLFVKKKRFVPIERIQSLNYNEGIIHRLFGLVQVSVETAGGTAGKADIELIAIKKEAAQYIEESVNNLRKVTKATQDDLEIVIPPKKHVLYKMSTKDLLLHATTSNGIGVVLASTLAAISQFSEYIPFEKISTQYESLVEFGFLSFIVIGLFAIIIAWCISLAMSYLANYNFQLVYDDEQLEITRGLLEKKKVTVPVNKIQAIRIVESPIRQLFGYAHVEIESASSMESNKNGGLNKVVLMPFVKREATESILKQFDSSVQLSLQNTVVCSKEAWPLFYRKYLYIGLIITIPLTIWVSNYFALLLILVALFMYLAFLQYKASQFELTDEQILIQSRIVNRSLYIIKRNKVQAIQFRQTPFQKKLHLYSANVYVMNASGGTKSKIIHHQQADLEEVYYWINKKRLSES